MANRQLRQRAVNSLRRRLWPTKVNLSIQVRRALLRLIRAGSIAIPMASPKTANTNGFTGSTRDQKFRRTRTSTAIADGCRLKRQSKRSGHGLTGRHFRTCCANFASRPRTSRFSVYRGRPALHVGSCRPGPDHPLPRPARPVRR